MAKAGIVYVGTDDGIAIYSDPGGTGRWRRVGHGLAGQSVQLILSADALNLTVALDGAAPLRSGDGGQSWAKASPEESEQLLGLLAASEPLLATAQGLSRWKADPPPAPGARCLALLAGKREVLLAVEPSQGLIERSEDGGATWAPVQLAAPQEGLASALAPSSYHMDVVWAGTEAGQLLRSDDRGRSWVLVAREPAAVRSISAQRLI